MTDITFQCTEVLNSAWYRSQARRPEKEGGGLGEWQATPPRKTLLASEAANQNNLIEDWNRGPYWQIC